MAVNKVVFGAVAIMDISDSTVTEETLAEGVTAYDKSGEKITGTMKQSADPKLQAKTATPTTSAQTVKPDSGYDGLSQVTVNAMPTATQATPSITVSSAGLITASATQSAGYVSSGTKSATKQLTTQAAKTVTPTTSNQTAVASGRYTTGAITVKGDANLKADNIKSGVSIFGVAGTYEGSGGSSGGGDVEVCTLSTGAKHDLATSFGCTLYENGNFRPLWIEITTPNTVISNNVVKNSFVFTSSPHKHISGMEVLDYIDYVSTAYCITEDATYSRYICFVHGTPIVLANGKRKAVQDIAYDDELLVWDFDNGCYSSAKPLWIKKAQTATYYYRCEFENGIVLKLVVSNGKCHRVFSLDDNRFEFATDCVGKMVMTERGATKLVSCERIDEAVKYYNIITDYHMNLYADSVLTSCGLNNLYPIRDMKFVKESREPVLFEAFGVMENKFYRGLRLSEQVVPIEELENYIQNLRELQVK